MIIQLTHRDIIAHQSVVLWPNQRQVEQDLLLCRAMTALFNDDFLKTQIAMRGGTLLHKIHLAPPSRYSEDIDLVVMGDRPDEHIAKAVKRSLLDVLGRPANSVWETVKLAVRNAVKPSKVLRVTYRVASIADPGGKPLEIVIEANATERTSYRPVALLQFSYQFRGQKTSTVINGFEINEMLGTKMRALFQRKRGRDLFDIYWALAESKTPVNPLEIIESFHYYMQQEGTIAWRGEFVGILKRHLSDRGFLMDMNPLLRTGISYNPLVAGDYIINNLLSLLPEKIQS